MSTLLFWQGRNGRSSTNSSNNSSSSTGTTAGPTTGGGTPGRAWLHASDLLLKGHVVYLVKFLGTTTVDQPKGIEVVKDAIRRLQFTQQLRKSETGAKTKKVEITISVDGVAIQEPRTNNILHQFPLHQISYCADDKEAKKFFSFIAKGDTAGGNNGISLTNGTSPSEQSSVVNSSTDGTSSSGSEHHECFVFVSNKLAAEITLTIGQAFDLAYKRFLMERGAGAEAAGLEACRARAQAQEFATRTKELAALLDASAHDQLAAWLARRGITHATDWTHTPDSTGADTITSSQDRNMLPSSPPLYSTNNHIADVMNDSIDLSTPSKNPSVGTKLEGLLLNSDSDSGRKFLDFDPRAAESDPPAATLAAARPRLSQHSSHSSSISTNLSTSPQTMNGGHSAPLLAPPPKATKRQSSPLQNTNGIHNGSANDLFGSAPFHAAVNLIPPPAANANNGLNLTPNYNLSDFNTTSSIFQTATSVQSPQNGGMPQNNSFSNGTSGMVGFDPFDTGKFSGIISNGNAFSNGVTNGFSNPMGVNGFSGNNGMSNGFGSPFPFGDKQNNSTLLDSSFTGFLDKRINEMKDGFGRGLIIGNEDFLVESLDPLRKN